MELHSAFYKDWALRHYSSRIEKQEYFCTHHVMKIMLVHMGLNYRKIIKTGKDSWLNVSKSGVSGSKRIGPVTINSRGGISVKLPGGLNYRGRWKK